MGGKQKKTTRYRWLILSCAWLLFTVSFMSWFFLSPMAENIEALYGISKSQYALAFSAPFITTAIFSMLGGGMSDRFGIRTTGSIGGFILGFAVLLRLFTTDSLGILGILIPMLIYGVGVAFLMPNLPKLTGVWFPPEETGIASGIYMTGMVIGMTLGLILGSLLANWVVLNIAGGVAVLIAAGIFAVFVRDAPEGAELPESPPMAEGMKIAIRSRTVWGLAVAVFLGVGGLMVLSGTLPGGLHEVYGLSMKTGGLITSLITGGGIVGMILFPIWSDKVGLVNPFLIVLSLGSGTFFFLGWLSGGSIIIWPLSLFGGLMLGAIPPLLLKVPPELPEIEEVSLEPQHIAAASGLILSVMAVGGFILPPLATWLMQTTGYTTGFAITSIIIALISVCTLAIREVGLKGRK